jgi:hypothetical protein
MLENTGTSPATNLSFCYKMGFAYSLLLPPTCELKPTDQQAVGLLVPGGKQPLEFGLAPWPMKQEHMDWLKSGKKFFYYGWARYWDAIEPKRCHVLTFCAYYVSNEDNPDHPSLGVCPGPAQSATFDCTPEHAK